MFNFYSDAVADSISDVDRVIHNGTQFVRNVLQRPQAVYAERSTGGFTPETHIPAPHYIDGEFTANPAPTTLIMSFNFGASGLRVPTNAITVYSVDPFSTVDTNDYTIAGTLNNTAAEYGNAAFQGTITNIASSIVSTPAGNQFKYVFTFNTPAIDTTGEGFPWWHVGVTNGTFGAVTEVEVLEPLVPALTFFNTDGSLFAPLNYQKSNILDVCFDLVNEFYYTIRFNNETIGTVTIELGDDFSEAEAGSAENTTGFNPARWSESSANPQFLRVGEQLSYNVVTGLGQIETTYVLEGDHITTLWLDPESVSSRNMWFVMRALDGNNNTVMSEGFGYDDDHPVTTTGIIFNSYITNLVNATDKSELREFRPLWHNTQIGTDEFIASFNGAQWTISGSETGVLSNATTGSVYDEDTDPNTPFSMIITSTAAPTNGEQFTFDLVTVSGHKLAEVSGTIGFERDGDEYVSYNYESSDPTLTSGNGFTTGDVNIELFANTDGSVNFTADDFAVSGTGSFPDVAVFTIESCDQDGLVVGTPLIESFDVIGDPSKVYNDYIDGRVQIACTSSGLSGGFIFIKIDDSLYKYQNDISLGSEDGSGALANTQGQIPKDGNSSFAWTHRSGIGGDPFLTYLEFDDTLDVLHLKTVDEDTLQNTTTDKEVFLNIGDYDNVTKPFKVFYDQNDLDTLYYVDAATNLQAFNLDDRISAFMAVNAEDVTLPAGTAQQTLVNADVINAWGESLDGKVVTFAVTAGDGAVSPSTDTTVSGGRATTQFTVGSTVGVSTITATVTEI